MKDLKQIKTVILLLEKEKEKRMAELTKINSYINKKLQMIKKMLSYNEEYINEQRFQLTKSIPALHKNLNSFTNKIKDIVYAEELEVEKLNQHKKNKLQEFNKLNQKIEMMKHLEERARKERILKLEILEQLSLDDLAAVKHRRGENE